MPLRLLAVLGLTVIALSFGLQMLPPAHAGVTLARPLVQLGVVGPASIGNLGGTVLVDVTVSGAISCTWSSLSWEGAAFTKTSNCSGEKHRLPLSLEVPKNPRSAPFTARVALSARGTLGTTTREFSLLVGGAPSFPSAEGTSAVTEFTAPRVGATGNWSGYALVGVAPTIELGPLFKAVSAEWTIPQSRCAITPDSSSSEWVGVDGAVPAGNIFQTGIQQVCDGRAVLAYAWWTDGASGYLPHDLFPVAGGDVMRAEVLQVSWDEWEYDIVDLTSGQSAAHDEHYSGPGRTAEWIVEKPGGDSNRLADFGSVTFSHLGLLSTAGGWTDPPASDALEEQDNSGNIETSTGPFLGSGAAANFTVSFDGPTSALDPGAAIHRSPQR